MEGLCSLTKNVEAIPVQVVLPAAGTGQRMGTDIPKQFIHVLGRPLLSYTIESFERFPWIQNIVVVVGEDWMEDLKTLVEKYKHQKVTIAVGKHTRHRSIKEGVDCVGKVAGEDDIGVVVIHDGVRPFIEEESLKQLVIAAYEHGATGLTRPLVSTVLSVTESGFLNESLDRSKYVASEMPQAFKYDVIMGAYQKCSSHDLDHGTECLHLAKTYSSVTPKLIPGPHCLWKVTYQKDIYAVEGIIKGRESCVFFTKVSTGGASLVHKFSSEIQQFLSWKNKKMLCVSMEEAENKCSISTKDLFCNQENIFYHAKCVDVSHLVGLVGYRNIGPHQRYSGIVIHVFDLTSTTQNNSTAAWLESLRQYIFKENKIASQHFTCLNALVMFSSEECSKSASIVADLIFNKNTIYSGQTFVL